MGIEADGSYSPDVLRKVVYAGTHASSFGQGSNDLAELAELDIPEKQVERITERIGEERKAEREAAVEAWQKLSLPEQQGGCPQLKAPPLAMVGMDGGRLQILDSSVAEEPCSKMPDDTGFLPTKESAEQVTGSEAPPPSHEAAHHKKGFWREDKVGCLMTMSSQEYDSDPCPKIPEIFVEPLKILKIVREVGHGVAVGEPPELATEKEDGKEKSDRRPGAPEPLVRTVIASCLDSQAFGQLLAVAAWARGFAAASRKVFLGDGSSANWGVWKKHFSHYTPIVDFIHVISYVFKGAMAARRFEVGWPVYCRWAQLVWSGQAEQVIAELEVRQGELGVPSKDEPETSACKIVDKTLTYLKHQRARMHYDEYRCLGLPIASSYVESTVKQINRRVKGTEKFWSERGAEAILQLNADYLSETNPMEAFWERRQEAATGERRYRRAA